MIERRGVIIVIFDLPVKTAVERRQYTAFRKSLIRSGYSFFQKSVYVKLLRNISTANREISKLRVTAPDSGEVQTLTMNLNVFRSLYSVRGIGFRLSVFADDLVFFGNEESIDIVIDDEQLMKMFEESEE